MRVLHLVNKLTYGGILRHVEDLTDGMKRHGVETHLAAWVPQGHSLLQRRNFLYLPLYNHSGRRKSILGALHSARVLRETLRRENIDVLHMHSRYVTMIGSAASLAHTARVYTVHSLFSDLGMLPWYPHHVICPNEATRDSFTNNVRASHNCDITVVRHGIQLPSLRTANADGENEILYVGRLVPEKGVDVLLRAYALLPEHIQHTIRLRIVGDGPERVPLEELSRSSASVGQVHFEGYDADPTRFMCHALALVFPSKELDSLGYVNLEAFACGLPVIASDLPQLREVLDHGKAGLLFRPGDVKALASALEYATKHVAEMRRFGRHARAFVEREHSMDSMIDGTLEVYHRAVARSKSRESAKEKTG